MRLPLCGRDGAVRAWATVDESDAVWATRWHWSFSKGYAVRVEKDSQGQQHAVLLHRALLGLSRGDAAQGDHINRDTLDNRRSNLRVVPRRGNLQNRNSVPGSSSSFRGVHFESWSGRWRAEVKTGGRRFRLGRFDTEHEAAEAARVVRLREMGYAVD
jgi:hypothetical protein